MPCAEETDGMSEEAGGRDWECRKDDERRGRQGRTRRGHTLANSNRKQKSIEPLDLKEETCLFSHAGAILWRKDSCNLFGF